MRLLATVLNIALIGTVIYLLMGMSADSVDGADLVLFALFLSAPIASLIAIYTQSDENWLSLYFKRKALEEKKTIERLNNKEAP